MRGILFVYIFVNKIKKHIPLVIASYVFSDIEEKYYAINSFQHECFRFIKQKLQSCKKFLLLFRLLIFFFYFFLIFICKGNFT